MKKSLKYVYDGTAGYSLTHSGGAQVYWKRRNSVKVIQIPLKI